MLRDKSLIPLSHQHQHALALCVRIERALPIAPADLAEWQAELAHIFDGEIKIHFAAEEHLLFPTARQFAELVPLVDDLVSDHAWLRERFNHAIAKQAASDDIGTLARRLSQHIRKEERQLFERMQELLSAGELANLGPKLEIALKNAQQDCLLPTEATRLRPKE